MRLKVALVERDEQGAVLSEQPIGNQLVAVDEEKQIAAFIPINAVDVEGLFWNRPDGLLQVHFALGAIDSNGTFHRNDKYGIVTETWGRERTPALWQKYGLDDYGAVTLEAVKEWMYTENVVDFAARDKWQLRGFGVQLCADDGTVIKDFGKGVR
jgi:hypothetical protein